MIAWNPAQMGLTYVTLQPDGQWKPKRMPEWFLQALFPEEHARRRADVAARVYEKLEPWGA